MDYRKLLAYASVGIVLSVFFAPITSHGAEPLSARAERMKERIEMRVATAEERIQKLITGYCEEFEAFHDEFGTSIPAFCADSPSPGTPPSLSLSASPSVIEEGDSTQLNWSSSNATACTASGAWSGAKALSGSQNVSPGSTATYTLACVGSGGTATYSTTVVVTDQGTTTPPSVSLNFDADPGSITEGNSAELSWSSTNAKSCIATGGWAGTKAIAGVQSVSPTTTTNYTLTCVNGTSSQTETLTVTVTPAGPTPLPVTLELEAASTSIQTGDETQLSWTSTNATTCTAFDGWTGAKALQGIENISPTATTTYGITCDNASFSVTKTVTVAVHPEDTPPPPPTGKVLISEVYYDTDTAHGTDAQNEWVELYNDSAAAVDLTGYTLYDGALSDAIATGTTIAANSYLVIANSTTTADFWTFPGAVVYLSNPIGNGLGNAGDALHLRDATQTTLDSVGWGTNTAVFNPGVSGIGDGISITRTSPSTDTDTAADWVADPTPTPGS